MGKKTDAIYREAVKVVVGPGQGHKRLFDTYGPEYPTYAVEGDGCRIKDADGRVWIDYLLAYGPILLGYNNPRVTKAVCEQMKRGSIFDCESPLQVEVARELCRLIPCAEMVCYFVGGSGATNGAVKIARALTGRDIMVRCGYHGWHNWCHPHLAGVPKAEGRLSLAMDYGDIGSLERLFKKHPDRIAGVIMEPFAVQEPDAKFVKAVQRLCKQNGAMFILDEIKTGFRVALGGAQEYLGVKPDLATFGKGCANGLPGSFIVGQRKIMERAVDVWLAATFHADALSLAAILATIREMESKNGIEKLWKRGERLKSGFNQLMEENDLESRLIGVAPMPHPLKVEGEVNFMVRFFRRATEKGVLLHPDHPWFISLAHRKKDIDETLNICADAMKWTKKHFDGTGCAPKHREPAKKAAGKKIAGKKTGKEPAKGAATNGRAKKTARKKAAATKTRE